MKRALIGFIVLFYSVSLLSQGKTVRYNTSVIVSPTVNLYNGDVCSGCTNIGYGLSLSSRFPITKKLLFRPEFDIQHISSQLDDGSQLSFANNLIGAAINFELGFHGVNAKRSKRAKNEVFLLLAPLVYHHNPYKVVEGDRLYLASYQTENTIYSKLMPGVKLGLNFNFSANKQTRIGVQIDYTLLASDYVDDVSKAYIDYTTVDPQRSFIIDPTQGKTVGESRGNSSNFDSILKASIIFEFSFSRIRKVVE